MARRHPRRREFGWWLLSACLASLVVVAPLPPGPVVAPAGAAETDGSADRAVGAESFVGAMVYWRDGSSGQLAAPATGYSPALRRRPAAARLAWAAGQPVEETAAGPAAAAQAPAQPPPIAPEELHPLLRDPYTWRPPEPAAGRPDNPPVKVKGLYATAWVAGLGPRFDALVDLVRTTELNAIVVDVKDDTGRTAYASQVPAVVAAGAASARIPDMAALVRRLLEADIYPIARLVVFKDPVLARARPELAVQDSRGGIWRDKRGLSWTDPHNREVWEYNLAIAREVAAMGFREIQFDYIRFPTDGAREFIVYPGADGRSRVEVIQGFLAYAREQLAPYRVYISIDTFGLVNSAEDDLGIGQHLESLAPLVDYVSPMVYPSHYAPGSHGIPDPDSRPYDTVFQSLGHAVARLGEEASKLRPWLQDFSLRHRYGPAEVRAQIQAVYDVGLEQWILWSPTNVYSVPGLEPAPSGD